MAGRDATNTNDRDGSEKSVAAFAAKWAALVDRYRASPPPHYSEDPKWADTLDKASGVLRRVGNEIGTGDLKNAHETLESLRDLFGSMRERNNQVVFSDRVDAFHHVMEQLVTKPYGGLTGAGLTELVEDAAVLPHLGAEMKRVPPPEAAQSADFAPLLAGVLNAVAELPAAARSGDAEKIKAARGRIKPAFAKLFVKFG